VWLAAAGLLVYLPRTVSPTTEHSASVIGNSTQSVRHCDQVERPINLLISINHLGDYSTPSRQ